jgi:hypothetical protein
MTSVSQIFAILSRFWQIGQGIQPEMKASR